MSIDNQKEQIIQKAWQDQNFKKALMVDAKKALQEQFNIIIPDQTKLIVLEETDQQMYIVIPKQPPLNRLTRGFWFKNRIEPGDQPIQPDNQR